jgi:hypothetical protein
LAFAEAGSIFSTWVHTSALIIGAGTGLARTVGIGGTIAGSAVAGSRVGEGASVTAVMIVGLLVGAVVTVGVIDGVMTRTAVGFAAAGTGVTPAATGMPQPMINSISDNGIK